MNNESPLVIRVKIPVVGANGQVPVDHGAALYGAISKLVPELHADGIGISPLEGCTYSGNTLVLERSSYFQLQVPYTMVPYALKVAGRQLNINGKLLRTGVPQLILIRPSSQLFARFVTVKGKTEEQTLREHIVKTITQFNSYESDSFNEIQILRRRVLNIHGKSVVAFGLVLSGLTDVLSVALQENGIGGRRRFGCGLLLPFNKELKNEQRTRTASAG